MINDPYLILKVDSSAKLEDIKKAYRKLVKIHHPDKGGDVKVILEINAAWEILKNKKNKDFCNHLVGGENLRWESLGNLENLWGIPRQSLRNPKGIPAGSSRESLGNPLGISG